jgi:cell division septation protein DedD
MVSLAEASVGKELHCTGTAIRLQPGIPALDLRDTQVGTLVLSRDFAAAREGEQDKAGLLSCDGLKYGQLPVLGAGNTRPPGGNGNKAETDQWISYLKDHTVYSAQAYQQLASAYHSLGEDDAARRILVAQRNQARGRLGLLNGFWQGVLGVLIGYGYQSVRALYWLAGLFALTVVLTISWFGPSKLIQPVASTTTTTAAAGSAATATATATATPTPTPTPSSTATTTTTKTPVSSLTTTTATARQPCSFMGQLGYAVNVSFPIITIDTNSVQQCDVAAPDPNPALVVFGWLVKALASTLAVIYAAGLGGLTTRSPGS